jgi:hypothetical protein
VCGAHRSADWAGRGSGCRQGVPVIVLVAGGTCACVRRLAEEEKATIWERTRALKAAAKQHSAARHRRWCSSPPQQWAFDRLAAAATRPRACRDPPNAGYKRECSRGGETTLQKNETRNGVAMHGGGVPAAPTLYMHRGGSGRNPGGALKPLLRAGTTARWHPGRSARGRRLSAPAAPRAGWWAAAGLAAAEPLFQGVGAAGGRQRAAPALPHRNQREAPSHHQVKGCAHQQHCMVPRHCYNLGFFALSGVSGAPRCGHPAVQSLSAWPGSPPAGGRSHEAAGQLKARRAAAWRACRWESGSARNVPQRLTAQLAAWRALNRAAPARSCCYGRARWSPPAGWRPTAP